MPHKILATILFSLLVFSLALPVLAADDLEFTPQVTVGDFTKGTGKSVSADSNVLYSYIASIYRIAIGAVGILAMVVLMFGGIRWITAGGNAEAIGDAKGWIGAALTGLVLALTSYVILYTINPRILQKPNFAEVQPITGSTNTESGNTSAQSDLNLPGCCGRKAQVFYTDFIGCDWVDSESDCEGERDTFFLNQPCNNIPECHPTNCAGEDDGTQCAGGYCYSGQCLYGAGNENESCGNKLGSICVDGTFGFCPNGYASDWGGRSCASGFYCCTPEN